ncbi:hypothetical protein QUA56_12065 [Microcoleus sp. N3A4]|uniref:hypothetical protein n=1 Tax=Microcoleus sp. N3A4 TaxID=3055379 RepID=UPI002FD0FD64
MVIQRFPLYYHLCKSKHSPLKLWDGRLARPMYLPSRWDTPQASSSNCATPIAPAFSQSHATVGPDRP